MTVAIETRSGACTHAGLKRSVNEDSYLASSPLFLVADGMGGHDAGDLASSAVVGEFAKYVGADALELDDVEAAMAASRAAVDAIDSEERAAGTTLTGVAVADVSGEAYWLVVNVGDSRTYRLYDGTIERLTVDHSVVQELVDHGVLDSTAAKVDHRRNVITRAIGAGNEGVPDYWMVPARTGDRILVCSDGLTGEIDDEDIAEILLAEDDPQEASVRLVSEAVVHGGRDNITAVVVDAVAVSGESVNADTDTSARSHTSEHASSGGSRIGGTR